jgi:predicted HicB family RNase H-like nuclease
MSFTESFDKLDLPLHGVRCPTIEFTATQKKKVGLDKDASNDDFLQALCQTGFKKIIPRLREEGVNIDLYKDRTIKEFKVLQELGFVDYILMIWDVINFCEKENNMSTKLTLIIEKEVIKIAKEYAKEKGQSLSELVENYFKFVTAKRVKIKEKQLSPKVRKLRGIIKIENNFDYQQILTEELSKKYGV